MGGSAVEKLTVECDKELTLPKNPTKTGYKFVSWADKNGKVILNGAKLAREDFTLYANWEKVEEKTTETKKDTTPTKTYTCPNGYTLYHSDPNIGIGDVCAKLTNKIKNVRQSIR